MRTTFPTRQFGRTWSDRADIMATGPVPGTPGLPMLLRFLKGTDPQPQPMPRTEIESLGDVFSREILLKKTPPLTLRSLVASINGIQSTPLPLRRMFLVAEGAPFHASNPNFELNTRLVFTWQASEGEVPDILLSTVATADDPNALLQLIAWSPRDGAWHFFERRSGFWTWAGNSFHALKAPTRGQGPFDSHINGGLVMKELRRPWAHWHSMNNSIPRAIFGAASEFNTDPLFQDLQGAETLEDIIRAGVRRWTATRFASHLTGGTLNELREYMRQVLWCTSINLVSSRKIFSNTTATTFDLPSTFFFDLAAINSLSLLLDENSQVVPARLIDVEAASYRAAVAQKQLAVTEDDGSSTPTQMPGDTHFAFMVPERAFEDEVIIEELVQQEVLSAKLGLCLILVDFTNPVFSPDRAALLQYVPESITAGAKGSALDAAMVAAIRSSGAPAGSSEAQFLVLWDHPDLLGHATQMLDFFVGAVQARLRTDEGIRDILDLADSRRETFTRTRQLSEFNSTLARGAAPQPHLAIRPDATIFVKTSDIGEKEL